MILLLANDKIIEQILCSSHRICFGFSNGEDIRKQLGLDKLDKDDNVYTFKIMDTIYCITASFFMGLFSKSINYLGKDKFIQKYKFEYNNPRIKLNIEDGIRDCLLFLYDEGDDNVFMINQDNNNYYNFVQVGAMQGWQCPICKKVLAPFISECPCQGQGPRTWTSTTSTSDTKEVSLNNYTKTHDQYDDLKTYYAYNVSYTRNNKNKK